MRTLRAFKTADKTEAFYLRLFEEERILES